MRSRPLEKAELISQWGSCEGEARGYQISSGVLYVCITHNVRGERERERERERGGVGDVRGEEGR